MQSYIQTENTVVGELAPTRYLGTRQIRTRDWIKGDNIIGQSSVPVFDHLFLM